MYKTLLERNRSTRQTFKSFQENLSQRLGPKEIRTLDVLGADFFYLVDRLASEILELHPHDAPLLDLSDTEYPWELQVFVNQFLRECAQDSQQLPLFCSELRTKLTEEVFQEEFSKMLDEAYQHHFYVAESQDSYLV